jgi:carboxyl-terminal processing protease
MDNEQFEDINSANLEKNRRLLNRIVFFFIFAAFLGGSFFLGYSRGKANSKKDEIGQSDALSQIIVQDKMPDGKNIDFSIFWKVWDLVKEKHVERNTLNAQKMVYGAIQGMLKATGDPYSNFFDPEESKSFSQEIQGSFEGIGAELGMKDNVLTVIAPLEGSPAQKAGVRAGDKIFKVDGKIINDLSVDQAVDLIRGKKGTEVKLTILSQGDEETKEISIIRDKIDVKSVKVEFKENDIAYVKISKFAENTDSDFNDAVNQIIAKKSPGIIIDLRNDPGGLLDKAVAIASRMMPEGKVVVTEEDYAGKKESLTTTGGDRLSQIPTVVLINEGSASASEILSGALRDNQGITLIGKKSFGKGSVQQLMDLPGGSSVKITVAKWLTPNGDYIMVKGIEPDVSVDMTLDDYKNNRDPQLDKALEVVKDKISKAK